jgi:Chaperone of endosialidase
MQSSSSPFLVNIVPLANVNTSSSGIDPVGALTTSVGNIQKMVNFDTKTINTNFLGAYPGSCNIQVTSPLILCNATAASASAAASNIQVNSVIANTITVEGTCYAREYVTLSDSRVKGGLGPIGSISFDTLESMNAYTYTYMDSPSSEKRLGLVAQEVEAAYPECIVERGGTKYVNYAAVTAVLLEAVKDLNARVKVLEKSA